MISDDEDETNLNDHDTLDGGEKDVFSEEEEEECESEESEMFKKLQKNLAEDLANKHYAVHIDKAHKHEELDSDDADDGDDGCSISDDESAESKDGGGGLYVKRKCKYKKKKLEETWRRARNARTSGRSAR